MLEESCKKGILVRRYEFSLLTFKKDGKNELSSEQMS